MEPDPLQSCPFQYPLEHMEDAVWRHRASVWRGKDVFVFLLHAPEHFDCFCSYRDIAVGVFRFQRGPYHFSILSEDLPPDMDDPLGQINVGPL